MPHAPRERSRLTEQLGLAVAVLPAAVLAGVLWLVTVPLLSQATAASLAIATLWCSGFAFQSLWVKPRQWRATLVAAVIQFLILWPLAWLMASYSSRRP